MDHPSLPNERQKDRTLGDQLDEEASGILAWLVRGCLVWQRQGLTIPDSVLTARQEYRGEEDTLGQFLQECCVLHEQASVKASRLYERYKEWALDNNLKAMNGNAFGLEMKKRFEQKRNQEGMFYMGIGFLDSGNQTVYPHNNEKSAGDMASEVLSTPSQEKEDVGSVPTFPKTPLYREENVQKESFGEVGTLPTHHPLSPVDKAASEASSGAYSPSGEGLHSPPEREVFYL